MALCFFDGVNTFLSCFLLTPETIFNREIKKFKLNYLAIFQYGWNHLLIVMIVEFDALIVLLWKCLMLKCIDCCNGNWNYLFLLDFSSLRHWWFLFVKGYCEWWCHFGRKIMGKRILLFHARPGLQLWRLLNCCWRNNPATDGWMNICYAVWIQSNILQILMMW